MPLSHQPPLPSEKGGRKRRQIDKERNGAGLLFNLENIEHQLILQILE